MSPTRTWTCASLLLASLAATSLAEAADPARGRMLAETCLGCHGVENYKNVYPTYNVPKLIGQHPQYLGAALRAYRGGERSHGTMHSQAAQMSDEDIQAVSEYLAGAAPLKVSGKPLPADAPKAAATCFACHGADGVGITPDYPTLTGQHRDYLERALVEYKSGGRRNPIMTGFVATLTAEDIAALAEFYAEQTPALETVKRRTSVLSKRED